jgi:hypothetical protein
VSAPETEPPPPRARTLVIFGAFMALVIIAIIGLAALLA